eukprot:TRINITY_DN4478_c0_g1_i1.p1 TRINITY_DN4478_c0_g1~~TRINITY_DN4478_c0_g1_i1.p1  ORF type:complete len:665 (-),score=98.05 TRINITY_DN4478_c0_g1_i1:388-2091(-)
MQFVHDTDWRNTCSRVFFPSMTLLQPSYELNGRRVCQGCASTCHQQELCLPDHALTEPLLCQCAGMGTCLFAERIPTGGVSEIANDCLATVQEEMKRAAEASLQQFRMAASRENISMMTGRIQGKLHHMVVYEDAALQQRARSVVPVDRLTQHAKELITRPEFQDLPEKEAFLLQLLSWFKAEFFAWVNTPPCTVCGRECKGAGVSAPTAQECPHTTRNVELYRCTSCGAVIRFPRYNDPGKLLETRQGRCGEWANCFCLLCRSFGYNTRFVEDFTDHVWVEVFSESKQRWIHLDCCENACDRPLLYERGWGKKLSYVLAFSVDEVIDVTRRYTEKYDEVLTRRNLVSEEWLAQFIANANREKLAAMPPNRREMVLRLHALDQQDIERGGHAGTGDTVGRISGSVDWRKQRGELGALQLDPSDPSENFQAQSLFDYQSFSSTTGLTLVGLCSVEGCRLRITPKAGSAKGAAWAPLKHSAATGGFRVRFSFQITEPGADGFAFVVQSEGSVALGEPGSGLGYAGIRRRCSTFSDYSLTSLTSVISAVLRWNLTRTTTARRCRTPTRTT